MTAHTRFDPRTTGTPEEKQRAQQLARTWPGQAAFAEEGAEKECRQCKFWDYKGYDGQRNLKQARCKQYSRLLCGRIGPKFPGWAKACKYFEAGKDWPRKSGMEGDYRQVNGPDHLWRDTRRDLRDAEAKGHTPFDRKG